MQGNKITPEKIASMRELKKTHTRKETADKYNVSVSTVSRHCENIESAAKVEVYKDFNRPFQSKDVGKCILYKFSELSPEDQAKYNNCKPAIKEKTRTYAGW